MLIRVEEALVAGRRVRHLGSPLVAATAQAMGLLQIILLLRGVGATRISDAYFFLFGWGLAPTQVVMMGVMYPRWLRRGRPRYLSEVLWVSGTSLAGGILTMGALFVYCFLSKGDWHEYIVIAGFLATNSAIATLAWAVALLKAAEGRSLALATVTLPANSLACLGIVFGGQDQGLRVVFMSVGLIVGNLGYVLVQWPTVLRGRGGQESVRHETDDRHATGWYLLKAITGYGSGLALQGVSATLPASGVTVVSIAAKVVTGFSGSVTNILLPRLVNRETENPAKVWRFVWVVVGGVVGLSGPCLAGAAMGWHQAAWVAIVLAWILATTANASFQRVAYRFRSPRAAAVSVIGAVLIAGGAWVMALFVEMTVQWVLALYVILDLFIGSAYAFLLRKINLGFAVLVSGIGLTALLFAGS